MPSLNATFCYIRQKVFVVLKKVILLSYITRMWLFDYVDDLAYRDKI